jgi:hypothetical protein
MPKVLSQDEKTIQIQSDNGQVLTVAKPALSPEVIAQYTPTETAPQSPGEPLMLASQTGARPTLGLQSNPMATPSPQTIEIESVGTTAEAPKEVVPPQPMAQQTFNNPQAMGLMDSGMQKQKAGYEKLAKTAQEQGIRDANYLTGLENQQKLLQEQNAKAQLERQKMSQEFELRLRDEDQKIAAAQPKDYWADKGTPAKIGAAIAIGLGAYAAAMSGGQNTALQIIENAIKRDVDLQAAKRQGLKENKQNLINSYQMKMSQFNDDASARAAATAQAMELAKIQIQKSATIAKSDEAKANAQNLIGQLEVKQGELYSTIAQKQAEVASKALESNQKKQEAFVPGFSQFATTKEGAAKLNQLVADTESAKDGIRSLMGLVGKSGKSINPDLIAEAGTTAAMLKGSLRTLLVGPGAVSEGERKLIDEVVADPTKIFSLDDSNKKRLTTLITRLDRNLAQNAKAYGLMPQAKSNIEEMPR